MTPSKNKVEILGNLGTDPDIRMTQKNTKVANLSIATTESWQNKAGEWEGRTEWHRVVIFNENFARVAEQYLRKGSTVYLEGQLQTRKWTDQQGVEKYTTEVVLARYRGELTMLGGRDSGGMSAPSQDSGYGGSAPSQPSGNLPEPPMASSGGIDDDIPF